MKNTPRDRIHKSGTLYTTPPLGVFIIGCLIILVGGGAASAAPKVVFYAGMDGDCCGEDPHPVHGHPTPDGGYVVGGKSIDAGQGWQGFAVKIGPEDFAGTVRLGQDQSQTYRWAVTFGSDGQNDTVNAVAPIDNAVFLGGLKAGSDGVGQAYLAKHDLETGQLIWSLMLPSETGGTARAIEVLEPAEGGGLFVGGLSQAESEALEGFKSFGNPTDGVAQIMYFDAASISGNTAPSAPAWVKTFEGLTTIKGMRRLPNSDDGMIALAHHEDTHPTLLRLTSSGDTKWKKEYPDAGEPTDVTVLQEEGNVTGFAFTGHGGTDESLDGFAIKVSPAGELAWKAVVGDPVGGVGQFAGLGPGNPKLIFDECWSIAQAPQGGMVLGCGTGIEGCDPWPQGSDIRKECDADPRKTWRSLVVRLDNNGAVVWQRTDSFQAPGEDEVMSSASEFVARTGGGGWMSVVDEAFGIGIMVIAPETSASRGGSEPIAQPEGTTTDNDTDQDLRGGDESEREPSRDDVRDNAPLRTEPPRASVDSAPEQADADPEAGEEKITIVGTPGCSSVSASTSDTPGAGLVVLAMLTGVLFSRRRFRDIAL